MTEIKLVLGSLRFERSVTLNAGLDSPLSWGIGGRGISAIQNALWDVGDSIKEQIVRARTQHPPWQSKPSTSTR